VAAVREIRAAVPEPLAVAKVALLPASVGAYVAEAGAAVRGMGLRLVVAAHAGVGVLTAVLAAGGPPRREPATVKALGLLRDQARALGGHLVVEWAPLAVKEEVSAWDPPGPAGRLMHGIKARLDPEGIMSPGRFVAGI
jgi:FAD/FMN-containing dehydrogenase